MVAFRDLWYRHPANNSTQYPCVAPHGLTNMEGKHVPQGFPVFGNQCAIRMGVCLKNAGVSPRALRLATCSVHSPDEMHIIRAADLANGLAGASIEGIGKVGTGSRPIERVRCRPMEPLAALLRHNRTAARRLDVRPARAEVAISANDAHSSLVDGVAGPQTAMLLGDHGADVVRVAAVGRVKYL